MPCNAGSWIQKAFDHYWHDWSKVINLLTLSFIELNNVSWKIFIIHLCRIFGHIHTPLNIWGGKYSFVKKVWNLKFKNLQKHLKKIVQTSDMKRYQILLKMKFLESPCLPSSHLRFQIFVEKYGNRLSFLKILTSGCS